MILVEPYDLYEENVFVFRKIKPNIASKVTDPKQGW